SSTETPARYTYAPTLQPVRNQPTDPLPSLPSPEGFWAEVTVPYVDLTLHNPPHRSPWLNHTAAPRLYYSQIMWIDDIRTTEDGQVLYRVNERYGTFGDIFWRSEEHTSELQSRENLVCRLLLEKKKQSKQH